MRRSARPASCLRPSPSRIGTIALLAPFLTTPLGCGGPSRSSAEMLRPVPALVAPRPTDDGPADLDPVAQGLLDRHNAIRKEHRLGPLSWSPTLAEAAAEQAAGMVELGKIRHEGADGSTPADRARRAGYRFIRVGENVASGQESIEEVMGGWMDSPGHRQNILGEFEELGASRAEDTDGRPYWCVVFATPLPRLDREQAAAELLRLINDRRAENDRDPLGSDDPLTSVAREHARAMARDGTLDPEGASVVSAVKEAGIGYRRLATIGFEGQPRPGDVLSAIVDDADHRRDLLDDGPFDLLGIGYAAGEDGRPFWCLVIVQRPQ